MQLATDIQDRIKPLNYDLLLFDLEFGGKWSYNGIVKIDAKISEAAEEIVINTKELQIHSAEVLGKEGSSTLKLPWPINPPSVLNERLILVNS